eukprot:8785341-Pyramimonas_sp.AAC.1
MGGIFSGIIPAGREATKRIKGWGFKLLGATRNLGADFSFAERRRSSGIQRRRISSIQPRVRRFRGLRSSFLGASRVVKTGGVPAIMYRSA